MLKCQIDVSAKGFHIGTKTSAIKSSARMKIGHFGDFGEIQIVAAVQ